MSGTSENPSHPSRCGRPPVLENLKANAPWTAAAAGAMVFTLTGVVSSVALVVIFSISPTLLAAGGGAYLFIVTGTLTLGSLISFAIFTILALRSKKNDNSEEVVNETPTETTTSKEERPSALSLFPDQNSLTSSNTSQTISPLTVLLDELDDVNYDNLLDNLEKLDHSNDEEDSDSEASSPPTKNSGATRRVSFQSSNFLHRVVPPLDMGEQDPEIKEKEEIPFSADHEGQFVMPDNNSDGSTTTTTHTASSSTLTENTSPSLSWNPSDEVASSEVSSHLIDDPCLHTLFGSPPDNAHVPSLAIPDVEIKNNECAAPEDEESDDNGNEPLYSPENTVLYYYYAIPSNSSKSTHSAPCSKNPPQTVLSHLIDEPNLPFLFGPLSEDDSETKPFAPTTTTSVASMVIESVIVVPENEKSDTEDSGHELEVEVKKKRVSEDLKKEVGVIPTTNSACSLPPIVPTSSKQIKALKEEASCSVNKPVKVDLILDLIYQRIDHELRCTTDPKHKTSTLSRTTLVFLDQFYIQRDVKSALKPIYEDDLNQFADSPDHVNIIKFMARTDPKDFPQYKEFPKGIEGLELEDIDNSKDSYLNYLRLRDYYGASKHNISSILTSFKEGQYVSLYDLPPINLIAQKFLKYQWEETTKEKFAQFFATNPVCYAQFIKKALGEKKCLPEKPTSKIKLRKNKRSKYILLKAKLEHKITDLPATSSPSNRTISKVRGQQIKASEIKEKTKAKVKQTQKKLNNIKNRRLATSGPVDHSLFDKNIEWSPTRLVTLKFDPLIKNIVTLLQELYLAYSRACHPFKTPYSFFKTYSEKEIKNAKYRHKQSTNKKAASTLNAIETHLQGIWELFRQDILTHEEIQNALIEKEDLTQELQDIFNTFNYDKVLKTLFRKKFIVQFINKNKVGAFNALHKILSYVSKQFKPSFPLLSKILEITCQERTSQYHETYAPWVKKIARELFSKNTQGKSVADFSPEEKKATTHSTHLIVYCANCFGKQFLKEILKKQFLHEVSLMKSDPLLIEIRKMGKGLKKQFSLEGFAFDLDELKSWVQLISNTLLPLFNPDISKKESLTQLHVASVDIEDTFKKLQAVETQLSIAPLFGLLDELEALSDESEEEQRVGLKKGLDDLVQIDPWNRSLRKPIFSIMQSLFKKDHDSLFGFINDFRSQVLELVKIQMSKYQTARILSALTKRASAKFQTSLTIDYKEVDEKEELDLGNWTKKVLKEFPQEVEAIERWSPGKVLVVSQTDNLHTTWQKIKMIETKINANQMEHLSISIGATNGKFQFQNKHDKKIQVVVVRKEDYDFFIKANEILHKNLRKKLLKLKELAEKIPSLKAAVWMAIPTNSDKESDTFDMPPPPTERVSDPTVHAQIEKIEDLINSNIEHPKLQTKLVPVSQEVAEQIHNGKKTIAKVASPQEVKQITSKIKEDSTDQEVQLLAWPTDTLLSPLMFLKSYQGGKLAKIIRTALGGISIVGPKITSTIVDKGIQFFFDESAREELNQLDFLPPAKQQALKKHLYALVFIFLRPVYELVLSGDKAPSKQLAFKICQEILPSLLLKRVPDLLTQDNITKEQVWTEINISIATLTKQLEAMEF